MAIEGMQRKQKSIMNEIRGKIKNVEFRTRRDGRIELGARRIPKQPLSPAQLSVREAYGKIYQKWTQLSEEEKQYYNSLGRKEGLSGWNVFFREKMKAQTFKVVLDCSGMSTNYTDYILIIQLSKYAELLNALNDDLTNILILDQDKQTELQFFRFVTKRESNNPVLLIKIPSLPPGGYYEIYIKTSMRFNNPGTQGSDFFLFYDDFNDPALPSWTKTSDLTVTVQNSKATFSSSFSNSSAYINKDYAEQYQIIAKITDIQAKSDYAALGFSDRPPDDLTAPDYSDRHLYFAENEAYIYASNVETSDVCINLLASIPSTYPAFARVINLYQHLIVQLNEKIASLADTNCVLDSYRRKPELNVLEGCSITLDIFAIAKAYAPEPVIYEVKIS